MFQGYQYNPTFDIYNGMFRILQILSNKSIKKIECNKIKLLDFYLLFPGLIGGIKLKTEHRKYKKQFFDMCSRYNIGSVANQARHVFERINPFQQLALKQLEKIGIIEIDCNDFVKRTNKNLPAEMAEELKEANENTKGLIGFLCEILYSYDLNGPNGIKERTGLMEFRYDAI